MEFEGKAIIVGGEFNSIIARQKSDENVQLGELLIVDQGSKKHVLQVYDLVYGSQMDRQVLELAAGLQLESLLDSKPVFIDKSLRNYNLIVLKPLVTIDDGKATIAKEMPMFFSRLREPLASDLDFLPRQGLTLGNLRSGSKVLNVDVKIPLKALTHHVLIAGSTGKGKSVLMKNLLWNLLSIDNVAALVIDPHDEYYGRNSIGLKDHASGKVDYYTQTPLKSGAFQSLKLSIESLKPEHFNFLDLTQAQVEAMNAYYKEFNKEWLKALLLEQELTQVKTRQVQEVTLAVLKRKLSLLLDIQATNGELLCNSVFKADIGRASLELITKSLSNGKTVVLDTSRLSSDQELLIASLIASEMFKKHKFLKEQGSLSKAPSVCFVLEEAPRVLNKEDTIFSTIAREGRKFKIGLIAITQTPSSIPRTILTNMNTKIILGVSASNERSALINSSTHDLTRDDKTIASLDVGEAIVSTAFLPIALPFKTMLFEDLVKQGLLNQGLTSPKQDVEKVLVGFES